MFSIVGKGLGESSTVKRRPMTQGILVGFSGVLVDDLGLTGMVRQQALPPIA